ncbi:MAG: hypothetical protein KF901_17805 [Myxococcales bacterium]|nr:hypothetical protein [Myxococcales bacterium]
MIPSPDPLPLFRTLHGPHGLGAGAVARSESHVISVASDAPEVKRSERARPESSDLRSSDLRPGLRKVGQRPEERSEEPEEPRWPAGRLVELTGRGDTARTSLVVHQIARRQAEGELVAWVQPQGGTFYPPDAAEAGVDLDSLAIVHVPPSALEAARAAELLLRSGAFGFVVVDLDGMAPQDARLPTRALARLHALCRRHDAVVAFFAPPSAEALGSLVSLRLAPRRLPLGDAWQIEPEVLRDKEHLGASMPAVKRRGPRGSSAASEHLRQGTARQGAARQDAGRQGVLLQLRQTLPLPFEVEGELPASRREPRREAAKPHDLSLEEVRDAG